MNYCIVFPKKLGHRAHIYSSITTVNHSSRGTREPMQKGGVLIGNGFALGQNHGPDRSHTTYPNPQVAITTETQPVHDDITALTDT